MLWQVPVLTRKRIWCAYVTAVVTDAIQLALGSVPFVDQGLDVVAMVITCAALGFHPLLLPTFVLECIPLVDVLPTWTGCTAAVVMLRKRAQAAAAGAVPPKLNPPPPVVDI